MSIPRPTDAELTILRTLWDQGPSTVRRVHSAMCEKRSLGYTSVLKTLQVMTEKGLVLRDASARSHVYRPAQTEGQTQRSLVDDLLARAFGGSAMKLVMQALSSKRASKDDLVQIKEMIARAERGEP